MKLKIAIAQLKIIDGNKELNTSNALSVLKTLRESKNLPDIVCFPELFTTGYDLKNAYLQAEQFPGDTFSRISYISKDKFIVIGSILEAQNKKYYNSAFILGKNGDLIGKYRKTHLYSPMLEKEYLTPGHSINVFNITELNDLKLGLAICYDLRFPEIFRKIALEGANIIFVPSEFSSPKNEIWKTLIIARAIENQIFMIGVNRVGKGKSNSFFGNSIISNGISHQIFGSSEEIKMIEINISSLEKIRKDLPLFKDRREDLYKFV